MASDILVIDDEADIRELVAGILSDEGHETRTAGDADAALTAISERVMCVIHRPMSVKRAPCWGMNRLTAWLKDSRKRWRGM